MSSSSLSENRSVPRRDRRRPGVPRLDRSSFGVSLALGGVVLVAAAAQAVLMLPAGGAPFWLSMIVTAGAGAMSFFLWQGSRAVRQIAEICNRAARGDLQGRVLRLGERGVLAVLGRDVNRLLDMIDTFLRELGYTLDRVSRNQTYRQILEPGLMGEYRTWAAYANRCIGTMGERTQEFRALTDRFEREVKAVADGVAHAAEALATMSRDLGAAAASSASDVQNVSAAVEQLTASIREIAQSAELTAQTVRDASQQVQASHEASGKLAATASQIADVVQTIRDRAEEVQKAIGRITQVLDTMVERISQADGAASSIASAVEQQTAVVQDVARSMSEVDRAVQRIAEAVGSRDGSRGAVASEDSPNLAAIVAEMTQRAEVLRREIATYMEAARGIAA